jgi:carbon monoxide dehydrogenase subunit G
MIIKIFIGLAVLVILFLVVASRRPDDFRVERSISISAPATAAFAYVNDLHKWQEMSPYAKLDPAAKYTFTGPLAGVGASMAWVGNSDVGEGRMTITESRPDELVRMKLEFSKPMTATHTAEFAFKPSGGQTIVTWSMHGKNNLVAKAMGLIMNMDKMIGGQFAEGLATLKTLSESPAGK